MNNKIIEQAIEITPGIKSETLNNKKGEIKILKGQVINVNNEQQMNNAIGNFITKFKYNYFQIKKYTYEVITMD